MEVVDEQFWTSNRSIAFVVALTLLWMIGAGASLFLALKSRASAKVEATGTDTVDRRFERGTRFWAMSCAAFVILLSHAHGLLYIDGFWPLYRNHACCDVRVDSQRSLTTVGRYGTEHTSLWIRGTVLGACDGGASATPVGLTFEEPVRAYYNAGDVLRFQMRPGHPRTRRQGSEVGLLTEEAFALATVTLILCAILAASHRASRLNRR